MTTQSIAKKLELIHAEFSSLVGIVLSEMLDDDVKVKVADRGERSLAAHYQSLADSRYVLYAKAIQMRVDAAFTFHFHVSPFDGRAEINFSLPLTMALYKSCGFQPPELARDGGRWQISEDQCLAMYPNMGIERFLGALETAWTPIVPVKMKDIEFETVPAVGIVHYRRPDTDPETNPHLADPVYYVKFNAESANIDESIDLCYHMQTVRSMALILEGTSQEEVA